MILISKHAGFCFGVRRATELVEGLIAKKDDNDIICTLGKLIHNEEYTKYLEDRGVRAIEKQDIEKLLEEAKGKKITLVTRTHGIEKDTYKILKDCETGYENFKLVDCTCPYVAKIHKIADENSGKEEKFFLIGQKEHPEVRSIVSYIKENNGYVFSGADELQEYLKCEKIDTFSINMAAQTTQNLEEWKKCQKIIKKHCTNIKIFDTICSVTEKRQTEAKDLCKKVELMLVIGGKGSSNTSKLYHICSEHCKNTYWIQTKDDIPFDKLGTINTIGITAGASTPDRLIQEVKKSMSEIMEQNFAELFAEYEKGKQKIYKGAIVKGTVMSISENEIGVDLGVKQTGSIKRDNITSDNEAKLSDMFKIGDEVEAKVEAVSDIEGTITLSKKAVDEVKNWAKIVDYANENTVVDATITKSTKGGLVALVDGVEVFIPASMTGVAKDADFSELVKTVQQIKIVEIKEDKKRAIGSIKAVLRDIKKAQAEEFWANIKEGDEFEGAVRSLTSYGAFVDLGATDGLVHITELSWKRIKHPSEVVKVGDILKVFVKAVDKENKKVSLGYKTEDQNPWNIFKSKYGVDDVASVKIVGITTFGAFAEIVPGVDGLIHISQIANKKIDSVANVLKVGDVVDAKIVAIDEEKQKVSLSVRALLSQNEETAEEATEQVAE
ncbi:MAG: bifunctional 4-hydroxy-3-methylbut-2-enyl diphosphate reductase/30S ribosomal protein S1 [Clostridia bacterium]|nr:bifunctional 4-hydroxy-3-methylbut-2-enyl diphosphate reductase/30S ribosomal protein S1 [Clostridia bacterium]